MQALEFWKTITLDYANLLESLIGLLHEHQVKYCVIGGQAVNAYAEPLVSLDLDLVIAIDDLDRAKSLLAAHFSVEEFPHSINVSSADSSLRVQIQTDPRYLDFPERATARDVLGVTYQLQHCMIYCKGRFGPPAIPNYGRRSVKRIFSTSRGYSKNIPTYASVCPRNC